MSSLSLSPSALSSQLGHFLLLKRLLPHLKQSADARVVAVSSIAHWFAPSKPLLSLGALNDASAYSPVAWYGWSKLCNILMARELARREPTISAYSVHPGGVQGKLLRYAPAPSRLIRAFEAAAYWDINTAALTVVRPLVEAAKLSSGAYLVPIARLRNTSAQASDVKLAGLLWQWSEALLVDRGVGGESWVESSGL